MSRNLSLLLLLACCMRHVVYFCRGVPGEGMFFVKGSDMKAKWVLVSTAVLCVVFAAQVSFGQAEEGRVRQGRAAGAGMAGAGMFEGLDLTQAQQAKMAEIRETMTEKIRNADTAEARREVFAQMRTQMEGVLTEEQAAKMRSRLTRPADAERPVVERPAARGDQVRPSPEATRARTMDALQLYDAIAGRLELTEAQQAKITKLREEAIKKLMNDIKAVLTDAQKAQLAQAQERLQAAQARPLQDERPQVTRENARQVRPGQTREPQAAERERPQRTRRESQREQ